MGLGRMTNNYSLAQIYIQPTTSWLLQCWSTFGAKTKPRATSNSQYSPRLGFKGSHHLPPYSILCTSPRGSHPNGFLFRDSQRGVSKLPRLELPQLCEAITSCSDLWSGWGLKQSYSSHQELSNDILHATCTHGIRGRFLTFCGRESNCQFWLPAFLFAITCVAYI